MTFARKSQDSILHGQSQIKTAPQLSRWNDVFRSVSAEPEPESCWRDKFQALAESFDCGAGSMISTLKHFITAKSYWKTSWDINFTSIMMEINGWIRILVFSLLDFFDSLNFCDPETLKNDALPAMGETKEKRLEHSTFSTALEDMDWNCETIHGTIHETMHSGTFHLEV